MRSYISLILFVLMVLISGCRKNQSPGYVEKQHQVVDIMGNPKSIPVNPHQVACIDVLGYSIIYMLGQADKIVAMQTNSARAPWVNRVCPPKGIYQLSSSPTVEELVKRHIDLVIGGYNGITETEQLASVGLPQIKPQPMGKKFKTPKEFVELQKQMVRIYGQIFGPSAVKKADDWCNWYDKEVTYVTSRTDTISESRRPRAYFVRGPSALVTHGVGAYVYWYGQMAGARMMDMLHEPKQGEVSMEELIKFNPQLIFIGRQNPLKLITADVRFKNITAVKDKKVFALPGGVFYWDGGAECGLLRLYLAKTIHPELFKDLNLPMEIKKYYLRFYHCTLTDKEVQMMIKGFDYQGKRENPFNI